MKDDYKKEQLPPEAGGDWGNFFKNVLHNRVTKDPEEADESVKQGYMTWCVSVMTCVANK